MTKDRIEIIDKMSSRKKQTFSDPIRDQTDVMWVMEYKEREQHYFNVLIALGTLIVGFTSIKDAYQSNYNTLVMTIFVIIAMIFVLYYLINIVKDKFITNKLIKKYNMNYYRKIPIYDPATMGN